MLYDKSIFVDMENRNAVYPSVKKKGFMTHSQSYFDCFYQFTLFFLFLSVNLSLSNYNHVTCAVRQNVRAYAVNCEKSAQQINLLRAGRFTVHPNHQITGNKLLTLSKQ